jgi:hypothetical protein
MGSIRSPCLRTLTVGLWLASLALTGCGGRRTYPVEGRVVVKDNAVPVKDLQGYVVTFESQTEPVGASGTVGRDGTFRVGTFKEGDGAVVGKHRVSLMPATGDARIVLPNRYHRFETSGLEVTVEPRKNEITLEVDAKKR